MSMISIRARLPHAAIKLFIRIFFISSMPNVSVQAEARFDADSLQRLVRLSITYIKRGLSVSIRE